MVIENKYNLTAKVLLSHLDVGFTAYLKETKTKDLSFTYHINGDVVFMNHLSGQHLILIYVHERDITIAKHYSVEPDLDPDAIISALVEYIEL